MHILPFSAVRTSQLLLQSVGANTVDLLRPMQRLHSDSEFIDINLLYFLFVFFLHVLHATDFFTARLAVQIWQLLYRICPHCPFACASNFR